MLTIFYLNDHCQQTSLKIVVRYHIVEQSKTIVNNGFKRVK